MYFLMPNNEEAEREQLGENLIHVDGEDGSDQWDRKWRFPTNEERRSRGTTTCPELSFHYVLDGNYIHIDIQGFSMRKGNNIL